MEKMENEDKGKGLTLSPSTCIRKEINNIVV